MSQAPTHGFPSTHGSIVSPEHDLFLRFLKIKGPGPRAWAELTPSVCHWALLAPHQSKDLCSTSRSHATGRGANQQCPVTHGGSQFRPSPGPWPLNLATQRNISISLYILKGKIHLNNSSSNRYNQILLPIIQ